jgi:aspartyl-tRNA(Asn)/glutamyl-tRNA(Gln) amidotransferase subunit C
MNIQEFENLTKLSRLSLNEHDKESFQKDFESILQYVAQLSEVNTENVEPLVQASGLKNVFREDIPIASIGVDAALSNAPSREGSSFKVPNVI